MFADMQFALQHAKQHQCLVIVVVPPSQHEGALIHLIALAGDKIPFSGRMMLAGEAGRLMVMKAVVPPPPSIFDVMFVGWGGGEGRGVGTSEEIGQWWMHARHVLTRAA